uniref:CWH43-like N-terminal domain-containing protein n=1 Tax=Trichobilharzia regenti TaxID=157069 RepID=A0AA85JWZ8_TRIRE|nr:unnamed protein product [Trichobilharzia regenti]
MACVVLHHLIIALIIAMVCTFSISYLISASDHHISVLFPYISDTGALPPESCVFGQLLNICSFLSILCIYGWYLHECVVIHSRGGPHSHIMFARVTCFIGCLSALGMSMVANFQEATLLTVHLMGALMVFGLGNVFTVLVTYSTRKHLEYNQKIFAIRVILCTIIFLAHIGTAVFGALCSSLTIPLPKKWDPNEKGYAFHALSSTCEWLMAFAFLLFFASMSVELKNYVLEPVKIRNRRTEPEVTEETALLT